ncbi:p-loop containing nucleoside triphosphate hydrolase protein [Paragonimus heterotremus]|uniref:p-loop containing nucleoside triphosphate hydrolase protein n=1 Tax=Paragonimus heterotremus TaxID=100268 RepID=A0A8J4WDJ5_9TREM|nr:p-loop containing nucleoside triphosphate hydrolase protein [Paragonimus heterotremus]
MAVDNDIPEHDSTSVHVAVRVRPQSAKEKLAMSQICTTVAPNAPQIILGKDSCFTFDCVFNINSNQEQIFQTLAKPLIDGCMSGYNATILAYGQVGARISLFIFQTGSGKTYTMGTGFDLGSPNLDAGIIPRAVQYLFSKISQCRSQAAAKHEPVPEFKVVAQFLELYNEELVDLLDSDKVGF